MNYSAQDVSAVVCTMNSIKSIEVCLQSLRDCGVGEIIVVDANSRDGTRQIADNFADKVITDPGVGLGVARNLGIAQSQGFLVLNFGSDNVISAPELEKMIYALSSESLAGVSAQTRVQGTDYLAQGLNTWWQSRFRSGPASVIGTPSLFMGQMLRDNPFNTSRQFSDDSELCERWSKKFGAKFSISDAVVQEVGKSSWSEIARRCRMYGYSDYENFAQGRKLDWSTPRKIKSFVHPLKVDFLQPLTRLPLRVAFKTLPFFAAFTSMRYGAWIRTTLVKDKLTVEETKLK